MLKIDWDFISAQEGGRMLHGYVPPMGRSGVTIATGVDLGYYGNANLKALPGALQNKILPYLGLTGLAASRKLEAQSLTVTEEEAIQIETPKRQEMVAALSAAYLRGAAVPFESLPAAAQTVMMSLTWQYGTPWVKCPHFWNTCLSRNWEAVEEELRNFGDAYTPRRIREADYLRDHLGTG